MGAAQPTLIPPAKNVDPAPRAIAWCRGNPAPPHSETSPNKVILPKCQKGSRAPLTKHSPASARKRIFDGAAEAKQVAVACSNPPTGRARWTLKLLEEAVVELNIVE